MLNDNMSCSLNVSLKKSEKWGMGMGHFLIRLQERQYHSNTRPLSRFTFNRTFPAQQPHPFSDPLQPETVFIDGVGIEADAPVLNFQTQVADKSGESMIALINQSRNPVRAMIHGAANTRRTSKSAKAPASRKSHRRLLGPVLPDDGSFMATSYGKVPD